MPDDTRVNPRAGSNKSGLYLYNVSSEDVTDVTVGEERELIRRHSD